MLSSKFLLFLLSYSSAMLELAATGSDPNAINYPAAVLC